MENSKAPRGTTSCGSNNGHNEVNEHEQPPFLRLPRNVRDNIYRVLLVRLVPLGRVDADRPLPQNRGTKRSRTAIH